MASIGKVSGRQTTSDDASTTSVGATSTAGVSNRLSLTKTYADADVGKTLSQWYTSATGKQKSQSDWDAMIANFDINGDGTMDGGELQALIVALLAGDPSAAAQLDSLMGDSSSAAQIRAARTAALSKPTTPAAASPKANTTASQAASGSSPSGGAGAASSSGDASTALRGKAGQTSGPPSSGASETTNGGYTVDQVVQDMKNLATNDTLEGGKMPDDATLHAIAQGIVDGANNYFPGQDGKTVCQTLVASAWKESKFNVALGNGGVFQCANNRYQDYMAAHPGTTLTHDGMSVNPGDSGAIEQSVDVALWAMSHPANGLGAIAGVAIPSDTMMQFLYFWNYNPAEVGDYMKKTQAFLGLENG